MNRITKVFYINCLHRTDRKQQIEEELRTKFKYDKAERLDATVHKDGSNKKAPLRGCTLSHIRIMREMIEEGWDSVMVIEDDAQLLVSREELDGYINAFLDDEKSDMLHIANSSSKPKSYLTTDNYIRPINRNRGGANHLDENCGCRRGQYCDGIPFYNPRFLRTFNTQSSSCYVLKKKMVKPLLDCYFTNVDDKNADIETLKDLQVKLGTIDYSWHDIIDKYIFLVPNVPPYGRLVVQRPSYSDIEMRFTDYKV
jgi:hypothetical protein